jgi:hypothetical protein
MELMVAPQDIERAVKNVTDRQSFLRGLLVDTLKWPVPELIEERNLGDCLTEHDLRVWQLRLRAGQPWGILTVEFAHHLIDRAALRQVLRGLVSSRPRLDAPPAWNQENLLFLCTTRDYQHCTFAHLRSAKAQRTRLATFGWQKGDRNLRTLCEFNLPALAWPERGWRNEEAWLKGWASGFDKEPLTRDFFRRFDAAIDAIKADLERYQKLAPADAYSRAQLLLERLVFLYFLQNRGWLDQKRDYLLSHFEEHRSRPDQFSYHRDFLQRLFSTLALAPGPANRLPGIPFLNGGLFDDDDFAQAQTRQKQNRPLQVRNATFAGVFKDLLEAFNFTVREDTPLDQDVAVDPEMLGKVFESIVLHAEAADPDAVAPHKRKATGSYYTPRTVVHFICREVLFQYLRRHLSGPNWDARLKALLELHVANGLDADDLKILRSLLAPDEGAVLSDRLRDLKCCDPAVGSGAFPVGLLHELLGLRRIAETAANGYVDPVRKQGSGWLHAVKEEIVQNCLFGVDIQQQAVEICRLRLWLSLVVDCDIGLDPFNAERQPFLVAIGQVSQLPNLDRNFHRGDSLLEGADFNSPFHFCWQLDFAEIFTADLRGFDIIVGNPPFVTARNPKKNELYRERWKRVCSGKYLLICPFFDLSFSLLRPGGQLGFIVSNAFAKREFGKPLIEDFFPTVDLQKVIDCSGLLFPGHGTPTCLVFGANQLPASRVPVRVAATLPGGGDLRTPPEESLLWHSLSQHHDEPGYADSRVVVADRFRQDLAAWPWNFDAGAEPTKRFLEGASPNRLAEFCGGSIGFDAITAANDIYYLTADQLRRLKIPSEHTKHLLVGEMLRNFEADQTAYTLWPYHGPDSKPTLAPPVREYLKPFRAYLEVRSQFRQTQLEAALEWFEFREYHRRALRGQLTYAYIATHLHVIYSEGNRVFNQHAPVIELPAGASPAQHYLIGGVLNSSTALFWLKQVCFNKGAGADEERDRFEFAGSKLEQLPVPASLSALLKGKSEPLLERLTRLSQQCHELAASLPALAMRKVLEKPGEAYHGWNATLPAHIAPDARIGNPFQTANDLRAALQRVTAVREQVRSGMIARQEEMDWLVYAAYGLLADPGPDLSDADLVLEREQRPFCLWAQAGGDVTRAVQLIPSAWSAPRRALWESRLQFIRDNEHVRRIEQPVYKRRWDEQWKVQNRWVCGQPASDAEFLDAFQWWLSEKAEWWLAKQKGGGPVTLTEWTAALWSDARVRAAWEVAAETKHRLEKWKAERDESGSRKVPSPAVTLAASARFLKALVREQSVPENIPFAKPWQAVEQTMRVSARMKRIRGRLNVPRERFWTNDAGDFRCPCFT